MQEALNQGLLHLTELRDWLLGEQRKANTVVSTTLDVPGKWTAPHTASPYQKRKDREEVRASCTTELDTPGSAAIMIKGQNASKTTVGQ